MDEHRGVHAVEDPAFDHEDLAAAPLFGRRPDHLHGDPEVVGHSGERDPGSHGGRRDTDS